VFTSIGNVNLLHTTTQNHARLKKYPLNAFSDDLWEEIYSTFRRQHVPCLPRESAADSLDRHEIQTTKRGIEISGKISFLPKCQWYPLKLCLASPNFSSLEGVTIAKLRRAAIVDSHLEGGTLSVTVE
jgi:hypothetical protein